jgi:hypothetical protein
VPIGEVAADMERWKDGKMERWKSECSGESSLVDSQENAI